MRTKKILISTSSGTSWEGDAGVSLSLQHSGWSTSFMQMHTSWQWWSCSGFQTCFSLGSAIILKCFYWSVDSLSLSFSSSPCPAELPAELLNAHILSQRTKVILRDEQWFQSQIRQAELDQCERRYPLSGICFRRMKDMSAFTNSDYFPCLSPFFYLHAPMILKMWRRKGVRSRASVQQRQTSLLY